MDLCRVTKRACPNACLGGDKGKYRLCIAKKSWKRLKEKIKIITRKTSPIPVTERIKRLNRLMYGWVNYFKNATGYQKFKELDVVCDTVYGRLGRSRSVGFELFANWGSMKVGRGDLLILEKEDGRLLAVQLWGYRLPKNACDNGDIFHFWSII